MSKERSQPKFFPVDCRLFYVLDGYGKIKTDSGVYNMNKGDILIINSGHSYEQIIEESVIYFAINFDFTSDFKEKSIPIPPSEKETEVLENVKFTDVPELDSYLYRQNAFSIKKKLFEILDEYSKMLPYYENACSALMTSVLTSVIRQASADDDTGKRLNIEGIVSYIQEHYSENITNKELSEIFHFHPNYINEIFKKKLGKSLHRYIMDVRISNAISMLEAGEMSIAEIAAATGFYDSCYFSRYFKKITGVSPKAYK